MSSNFGVAVAEINSLPKPLPGYIGFQSKPPTYHYGVWFKNTYVLNGKVYHDSMFLGRVVNKAQGIFYKNGYGLFRFTLENGFGEPPETFNYPPNAIAPMMNPNPSQSQTNKGLIVDLGDVWMIDQISKQIGLDKVLESLIPESADTLKALVAFRLIKKDQPYSSALEWYCGSYANELYPNAKLDSPRISEFHKMLGEESIYRKFFQSYLENIINCDIVNKQVSLPILIDSTGLPNSNKTDLTATNCHNGKVSHEIRLIYVVDKNSRLPIYFKFVNGNIIDNTTLISTINTLNGYNIDVKMAIMDAGYYTDDNIEQLLLNGIDFITRMPPNRNLYRQLMRKHSDSLGNAENIFIYQERVLFGIKESVTLFGKELFAYVMLDVNGNVKDITSAAFKYVGDKEQKEVLNKELKSAGKFIILSSIDYSIEEILPMYYTRQLIEQLFDVSKNNAGLLPLRGHSTESIRGTVLTSFIATILYSSINFKLSKSKCSACGALITLGYFRIAFYESGSILSDITKAQKKIFAELNLEDPFTLEIGNILKRHPLSSVKSANKKRGRPKGSLSKTGEWLNQCSGQIEGPSKTGRPKGVKNKAKKEILTDSSVNIKEKRQRGRPKGSKNRVKTNNPIETTFDVKGLSKRGHPKCLKIKDK